MDKNDQAAIRAVLSGDKRAYEALVLRHTGKLFRVAFRITGNEADAEDVVQEAFLQGYRKLESFESRSDFGTWIYRIAVHCALKKIRGSEQSGLEQNEIQVADSAAGPDRLLLSGEIERTAFVLRYMENRTCEEIGTALDIAPNAAKQAVFRAVQKLRRRLAALRVKI
jgi:RNA polymerase sigma-70 factor (ECF subfamily)